MDSKLVSKFVLFLSIVLMFGCKSPKKTYYQPSIVCELKTPDDKVTLKAQVKFSKTKASEKTNTINLMYEKLFFNGLRQNNCVLNQIIIDPNPRVNYKEFLNTFWYDDSREGEFHKVLSKKKNKNSTTTYYVEFDLNKLKTYLNENNIK